MITATIAGLILGIAGIFLTPVIFDFLAIPEILKQFGKPLASIYAGGIIFHYILINTNGILRSCKGIKKSLRTMAVVCVTNIALNFFFVFFTPLGFKGIALSTAVSVSIGSLWNLWLIKGFLLRVKYLYICMISEPFMAWGVILGGGLNGAGDTKAVMIRVALSLWLIRIPLSYIFGVLFGLGAIAIWWSMNASLLVQAILMSRRYFNKHWLASD